MRVVLRTLFILILLGVGLLAAVWLWPSTPLEAGARADRIVVEKSDRRLTLFKDGKPLKTYSVSLGWRPDGAKTRQGDGKTPEGRYVIDWRNPSSKFHRALHVSYPDASDRAAATKRGVSPGGDIMIHGMKNGFGWMGNLHRLIDWTDGCIAVTDTEIKEIWRAVPNGTPIEIKP